MRVTWFLYGFLSATALLLVTTTPPSRAVINLMAWWALIF